MGRIYLFLSRWTPIDRLIAPWNARVFDRQMAGRSRGAVWWRICVSLLSLAFFVTMEGSIAVDGLKKAYLSRWGVQLEATLVAKRSFINRRGWISAEFDYEFAAPDGWRVSGTLPRAHDLKHLVTGDRIEVLYATDWPDMHMPRLEYRHDGFLFWLAIALVLLIVHDSRALLQRLAWLRRTDLTAQGSTRPGLPWSGEARTQASRFKAALAGSSTRWGSLFREIRQTGDSRSVRSRSAIPLSSPEFQRLRAPPFASPANKPNECRDASGRRRYNEER